MITVELDPLREEVRRYADRCRAAAVPIRHLDVLDHAHASLSLPRLCRGVDALYRTICEFVADPSPRQRQQLRARG